LPAWIRANAGNYAHLRGENAAPVEGDWWDYLQDDRRSAVAHALREPGREELDPNDPEDRAKLGTDAGFIEHLVGIRIRERWGNHAVWQRPRAE
jgi:hypothetical protein